MEKISIIKNEVMNELQGVEVLSEFISYIDKSFLIVARIDGCIIEYGYNGTDKIIITCNGKILSEKMV